MKGSRCEAADTAGKILKNLRVGVAVGRNQPEVFVFMPNRILRDWTASDRIDQLSPGAEVFFTRVIMKADDFGLYYGNPKLLNSALFPLKDYDNGKVSLWLTECIRAGIIRKYTVDGKDYIQIPGFDQRLRLMKSKFPAPPENVEFHAPSNDGQLSDERPLETKRNEVETETKQNAAIADVLPFESDQFAYAWNEWLSYKKEKKQKLTQKTKEMQLRTLGARPESEAIGMIGQSIQNGWTGLFEFKNKDNGKTITAQGTVERLNGYRK